MTFFGFWLCIGCPVREYLGCKAFNIQDDELIVGRDTETKHARRAEQSPSYRSQARWRVRALSEMETTSHEIPTDRVTKNRG